MHVEKFTRQQCPQLQVHYERNLDRQYSNENIDLSKSHENYNLAPDRGDVIQYMNDRIEEVKHINRKDINVMCTWCVTLPKEFKDNEAREKQFFKETYAILSERYGGEQNVLSAYVHKDEKTPHMHFSFIPVKTDKDGQERLCAKEVIDRTELKTIHRFMEKELSERMQEPVHMLNGATRDGNKTVTELKRESELKEQEQLKEQTQKERDNLQVVRDTLTLTAKDLKLTEKDLQTSREALEKVQKIDKGLPTYCPLPDGKGFHKDYYTKDFVQDLFSTYKANVLESRQRAHEAEERANKAEHELSRYDITPQQSHNPDFLRERARDIDRQNRQADRQSEEWFREHGRGHDHDFSRGR